MADLTEYATERETTVVYSPGDPVVRIWTNVAKHIRTFRNDPAYVETRTWPAEPSKALPEAVSFEIRRDLFEVARGRKRPRGPRKPKSEDQ
jgi:hypothetical protein